jgi:type VI secretion system protein ImpH
MKSCEPEKSLEPVATAPRRSLGERLAQEGYRFDFFQAVWLLERYFGGDTLVGQRGPVAHENLRFRPDLALGFPATDIGRILSVRRPGTDEIQHLMEVTFLGLYGVATPLPLHYAIDILRGADAGAAPESGASLPGAAPAAATTGTSPVRDFLDIFHHRLISLFFRSWLKYRYERAFAAPQRDVMTEYLRLLCGLPPGTDAETLGVAPLRMLRYAGTLTQHPRSATTLGGLLSDFWAGLPITVQQFVGHWLPVAAADQNRMGNLNCALGTDLTVGEQVYDLNGMFYIRIGPVDWETYLTFVPGGTRFRQTRAIALLYRCDPLAFSFEVTLRAGEVPELCLSSTGAVGALGLTSWVRTADLGETTVVFAASEETPVQLGGVPGVPRAAAA